VNEEAKTKRHAWSLTGGLLVGDQAKNVKLQTGDLSTSGYNYFTVQLGTTAPPPTAAGNSGFDAVATIHFNVNGNPITRQIGVGQGMEISGPAESIVVIVNDTTPASWIDGVHAVLGAPYTVTVSIVPGTRVGDTQALLRNAVGTLGNFGGLFTLTPSGGLTPDAFIPVPQDAGVVGFWIADLPSGAGTGAELHVAEISPASIPVFVFQLSDSLPHFVPLVPGATQIFVFNKDAVNSTTVSILWVIDG
jgi:hypothetical protein